MPRIKKQIKGGVPQSGGAIDRGSWKRYKNRSGEEVMLKELSYP